MTSYVRRVFIASVAVGMLFTSPTVAQDNIMTNSGTWFTSGNWSLGAMPSGGQTAIINTNIVVSYNATLPTAYTGNLILREGAKLDFDAGGNAQPAYYFPSGAASEVHCYDGSLMELRQGTASKPIILHGKLTIQHQNQAALTYTSLISDAPGSIGSLTIQRQGNRTDRKLLISPSSASTYSGGTTIEPHPAFSDANNMVWVKANGAFGSGDVTINGTAATMILDLDGATTDVIDDEATLHMLGSAKLDLNDDNETVAWLFIDGVQQATGTWGATGSGATHIDDVHFMGTTGRLTVTGGTDSSPPWPNPMTFASVRPLTTTSIVATATTAVDVNTVTYLFTNDTTGASSGWQSGTAWTNIVTADSVNDYRVKAKDSLGNEGRWSDTATQSPFIYNIMTNSGTWVTGANWTKGAMPSDSDTAVINTNVVVSYIVTIPDAYTGDLILRAGASLNLGDDSSARPNYYFPVGEFSEVHCYDGSLMEFRTGTALIPIILHGNLIIQHADQALLNVSSSISGSGSLSYQTKANLSYGDRNLYVNNVSASTYTGGTTIEPHSETPTSQSMVKVYENDAFGTGDVTIDGSTATSRLTLSGSTTDVIDDGANLYLVGAAIVDLQNDTETVNKLFFDGVEQATGTWGPTGAGADYTNDTYFLGTTGRLTVLGLGGDTQAPTPSPMTFSSLPAPLTTTSIVMTATEAVDTTPPIYYIFTNDTTGASSGWSTNRTWTNNVAADSVNDYRVKAKDDLGNATDWSTPAFTQSPLIYNIMTNSGTWPTAANWSQAHMPTNAETAIINTSVVVSFSVSDPIPSPYTGNLILRAGAAMDLGLNGSVANYFPGGAASEVHCYEGSLIEIRNGTASKPIFLHGNLTIQHQNQDKLTFTAPFYDGPGSVGSLTIQRQGDWSARALQFSPSAPSTYSGGTTIEPHPTVAAANNIVWVGQNNAFGTGDVTIDGSEAAMTLTFNGTTTDVIDDSATLYLVDDAKLEMGSNNETVYSLIVDGSLRYKGTYGSTSSGAENQDNTLFGGTGILTVLSPVGGSVFRFR